MLIMKRLFGLALKSVLSGAILTGIILLVVTYTAFAMDDDDKEKISIKNTKEITEITGPLPWNQKCEELKKIIKDELKENQNLYIELVDPLKFDLNNSFPCVALTTNPNQPEFQEVFHLYFNQLGHHYLNSLGKFSSDTFQLLSQNLDFVVFICKKINDLNWSLIKAKPNKSEVHFDVLKSFEKAPKLKQFNDGFIVIGKNNSFVMTINNSFDSFDLITNGDWGNTNTSFKTVGGVIYQITPSEKKEYCIYAFKKTNGKYECILTNVSSKDYIESFIPDKNDPTKIIAYQTGKLSELRWHFCDKDLQKKMEDLTQKIQSDLGEYGKYSWYFSAFPQEFGANIGAIKFDSFIVEEKDGNDTNLFCTSSGFQNPSKLKDLKFIPFKPEEILIKDIDGYPINYAVFRSPKHLKSSAPTVMIVDGGPHEFIEYNSFLKQILFFNDNGYHVVIPQGLFRLGYPVEHAEKSEGQYGDLDIEHLKYVLSDLQDKSITSQPVYIMGGSYGGLCCALLAFNSKLVKSALIENAHLDLTGTELDFDSFTQRRGEKIEEREKRLKLFSPSWEAPLPEVPVLLIGTQTDVRCSIEESRKFAQRLVKKKLPFTYLEHKDGGHDCEFDYLDVVKDFFEGTIGKNANHKCLKEYELKVDTIGFFKEKSSK